MLKALTLGAKGVLLERAWPCALGADGEAGVLRMLDRLRSELETAMALTACVRLSAAGQDLLARRASAQPAA